MPKSSTKKRAPSATSKSSRRSKPAIEGEGKRCDTCNRWKKTQRFRLLADKQPKVYADTCLICEAKRGDIPDDPKEFKEQKIRRDMSLEKRAKIQQELAYRELCRRKLLTYVQRYEPSYLAGWVHHKMAAKLEEFLEKCVRGEAPRLMLFLPPRHGKSMLASDYFVSWALGRYPWLEFISTSHSSGLPIKASRRIRSRLQHQSHQAMFEETKIASDSRNVEHWNTTGGGGFLAAGVGGGITGHGAHVFVIDDPVKDAEEADSETVRENHWDWWSSTASTRVAPGGGVLYIATRWHDDDLGGRMLSQEREAIAEGVPAEELENWEVISFPALAEEDEYELPDGTFMGAEGENHPKAKCIRRKDEALHPDRWPETFLRRKRRTMQPRHWSALYQQNPVPDEGINFTKDMFITQAPRIGGHNPMVLLSAWDLAIGQKQHNDWTVGVVGGIDSRSNLHLLDMVRGRWGTMQIVEAILDLYQKYPEIQRIGVERGQLELAIKQPLESRMEERRLWPVLDRTLAPIQDKEKRAGPLQGMMQHHRVLFPPERDHPWVTRIREEMLRFPAGVHDDTVDALAWLARMAYQTTPPQEPAKPRFVSWKENLKYHVAGGNSKDPMAA